MTDRAPSPSDVTALIAGLSLVPAEPRSPTDLTQAELDLVLARMSALITLLRDAAPSDTTRLAERLLLADLAFVAARFRAGADAASASLEGALDALRSALDGASATDAG